MKAPILGAAAFAVLASAAAQTPFTPGDLAVLQAGDGAGALSTAAAPLFVDEFGLVPNTLVQQFSIPAGGDGLTLAGTAGTEGALALSPNGTFLTFAGYSASAGTAGISSSAVPRAVGVIDHLGGVSITASTAGSPAFSGNSVSSAASDNHSFWLSGSAASPANGGVWYSTGSGAPAQISGGNLGNAKVFGGNLYSLGGSGTPGIYQYIGLPTGAAVASLLFSTAGSGSGANASDFAVSPDGNTIYVADDGGFLTRGIQKWVDVSGTWTFAYRMAVGNLAGAVQLTVEWGATPAIFTTTSEPSANRLVEVVDNGSVATATDTTLDTAGANTVFRGVDFAPIPEPSVLALSGVGLAALLLRRNRVSS